MAVHHRRLPCLGSVIILVLAASCRSGAETAEAPTPRAQPPEIGQPAPEPVVRNVPYEGALPPGDPPKPPLPPVQKPLSPAVQAALDVWWERPSPKGPDPIPVNPARAIYIVGGKPIDRALPGPWVFGEHAPPALQVARPKNGPISNNMVVLSQGEFRMVAFDRTVNDTKLSRDSLEFEAQFVDEEGNDWRVIAVAPAKISPNPVADPWVGGVVIDSLWHGETGRSMQVFPLVVHKLGSWAWADVWKNEKRVASSALTHIMLTNNTRNLQNFHYKCYDCLENPIQQVHLIVFPSAYLPAPGGFLHVMWENSEWVEGSPEEIMAKAPKLGKDVPTIELAAAPYLRWNKEEIRVKAGQEYRLIVHNQDPSSFHQFYLHSMPEDAGHHQGQAAKDPRHEHTATAGRIGPLWKPDGSHEQHGDPPAPRNVFFPLPQGSTWATFVKFEKPGEYEFMCPVSNHYRRGMHGKFIVTASGEGGAK
jgi:uncharacterized cupredoxin-like copper-binding protein